MTVANLYTEIDFLCESDTTTFPVADKLRGINLDQGEALMMMMQAQGYRKVGEKTYYTDLKAQSGLSAGDNGYNGEYAFDSTWIKPTAFYIKYPDQDEHQKAYLYDVEENSKSEFDADMIDATFSETKPYVRFARDSFFVRPFPDEDVTDGIYVLAEPRQSDLTATTESPVMESNFHRWYVLKQALRFGKFRPGITRYDVEREIEKLENKIKAFYKVKVKTPTKVRVVSENFK